MRQKRTRGTDTLKSSWWPKVKTKGASKTLKFASLPRNPTLGLRDKRAHRLDRVPLPETFMTGL